MTSNPVHRVRARTFEEATPELVEHAQAIRALGRRILDDVLAIGERLTKARRLIAHGDWLCWLDDELNMSEDSARRFIDVWEMHKSRNLRDFSAQIPLSALYLLAGRNVPEEIRDAVIAHAKAGERVTVAAVRTAIEESKPVEVRVRTEYTTHEIVVPYTTHEIVVPSGVAAPGHDNGETSTGILYGEIETSFDLEIKRRMKRIAQSASRRAFLRKHESSIAVMELRVGFGGDHAIDKARRLVQDGPFSPFEAIAKLLPLLTDEEWDKLATIVHERATGHHSLFKKPPKGNATPA